MVTLTTITVHKAPENPWMLALGIAIMIGAIVLTRIYDKRVDRSDELSCGYCRSELKEKPALLSDRKTRVMMHVCTGCGAESFPEQGSAARLQQDAIKSAKTAVRSCDEKAPFGGGIIDLERHPRV